MTEEPISPAGYDPAQRIPDMGHNLTISSNRYGPTVFRVRGFRIRRAYPPELEGEDLYVNDDVEYWIMQEGEPPFGPLALDEAKVAAVRKYCEAHGETIPLEYLTIEDEAQI